MSKPLDSLREALFASGLVQPLDSSGRAGSISILCREVPGQTKGWMSVVDELLASPAAEKIDLHVCRRYVRKNGNTAFGWFVGITAKNAKGLVEAVEALSPIIAKGRTRYAAAQVIAMVPQPAAERPAASQKPGYREGFKIDELTDARPRAPEYSGPDPRAPKGMVFRPRVRMEGSAEITEMPLPHVYTRDINRPAPGSNKGAAFQGNNSELFKGLKENKS